MKIVLATAASFAVLLLFYGFGAFVAADFNITHWHQDGRFFVGLFGILFSPLVFIFVFLETK